MLFSDGPLFSRMFAWRSAVLVNRTRSGPESFCALPRKRYRFWRLSVLRYATQLSYIFHYCHCTFVTTLLRLFICLLLNLPVRKRALFAELLWSDFSRPLRFPVRLNSIFLLSMCIDTPGSTTNSLSSGFVTDGAGWHQTSVGEKKVDLSFPLSFRILVASLHASPRAHRSCRSVSSSDLSSNFTL